MSERLPYEESIKSRLNDLPVPDEERAWQNMKLMLDDDDDRRVIPPIFLRSCMGWGLLLLTGLVIVWLIVRPEKYFLSRQHENAIPPVQRTTSSNKNNSSSRPTSIADSDKTVYRAGTGKKKSEPGTTQETPDAKMDETRNVKVNNDENSLLPHPQPKGYITSENSRETKNPRILQKASSRRLVILTSDKREVQKMNVSEKNISKETTKSPTQKNASRNKKPDSELNINSGKLPAAVNAPLRDTTVSPAISPVINKGRMDSTRADSVKGPVKKIDSPIVKKPIPDSTATAASPFQKKNYFSMGVGLQQQLPFGGQKSSPYNYYGRKGSLADYLPSVYIRYHKAEKWFLHTEFRYGAPQNVKEVTYAQESFTKIDSAGGSTTSITTTNISRLKKTFYHQVPVSFGYFIRPGWSVGAGFMYSRFFSAVSEQEARKRDNISQTETVNKKIVQAGNTDSLSVFTTSQVHLIISTEYNWKRISAGIRYAKGLQPFIRYTTATGVLMEEKNQSVNVFVRFRLWKENNTLKN